MARLAAFFQTKITLKFPPYVGSGMKKFTFCSLHIMNVACSKLICGTHESPITLTHTHLSPGTQIFWPQKYPRGEWELSCGCRLIISGRFHFWLAQPLNMLYWATAFDSQTTVMIMIPWKVNKQTPFRLTKSKQKPQQLEARGKRELAYNWFRSCLFMYKSWTQKYP